MLSDVSNSDAIAKCTFSDVVALVPSNQGSGTPSLRILGTTALAAAAGNDARFPATVTGLRLGNGVSPDTAAAPKDLAFTPTDLAGGLAINWNLSDVYTDTLSGSSNKVYTFSNAAVGRSITVLLKNGTWTGTTITWPTLLGTAPIAMTGNTVNVYTFISTALGIVGVVKSL